MDKNEILKRSNAIFEELVSLRRKIHENPELSFQEYETASLIETKLKRLKGMTVEVGRIETGLPTGVVGTLSSGEGPSIALRADMDALPIMEKTNHSFRSKNNGVMHACGHDAHTSIVMGAAVLLSELFAEKKLQGTVKFIFQPAEEDTDERGLTGSPYMIRAGVLDDIDAVLALHMDPEYPVGEVKLNSGYSMSNVDTFEACISGIGGHAAYPHLGTDPIWMLGPVLQALYGLVNRRVSPLEPAVISLGHIEGGSSTNIIPREIKLKGTIRTYDDKVREQLHDELDQIFSITKNLGGEYQLNINRGEPALDNHPVTTDWLEKTIKDLFPHFKIRKGPFGMGGEDFGYMTRAVPGSMFFLGAAIDDQNEERGLHMPTFDIDEKVLPIGVAILAETATRYLSKEFPAISGNEKE